MITIISNVKSLWSGKAQHSNL